MGATGAIIMSFFGAVFTAMTLSTQFAWRGPWLALPFVVFALIALAAWSVARRPGEGVAHSPAAERAILWSSIGEGVGIFVAANVVINLGHREFLLPSIALVVGLHFLPMAHAIPFRPFYVLGGALLAIAASGFVLHPPLGAEIAGGSAALVLWVAALIAVQRERRAKLSTR
jgi:hypothetical protein